MEVTRQPEKARHGADMMMVARRWLKRQRQSGMYAAEPEGELQWQEGQGNGERWWQWSWEGPGGGTTIDDDDEESCSLVQRKWRGAARAACTAPHVVEERVAVQWLQS